MDVWLIKLLEILINITAVAEKTFGLSPFNRENHWTFLHLIFWSNENHNSLHLPGCLHNFFNFCDWHQLKDNYISNKSLTSLQLGIENVENSLLTSVCKKDKKYSKICFLDFFRDLLVSFLVEEKQIERSALKWSIYR